MSIVVMLFVEQLSQTGMRQALIQRAGDVGEYLSTAWTSQIVRGALLGGLLFFLAEPIERFFEKDGLAELLRLLAALPIMQGFFNMGFVYLEREMQFDKVVIQRTTVSFVDILLSVLFAWIWPCAIALVCGRLAAMLLGIVLSFSLEHRRANFGFSMPRFRELYKFGFWIFVSSLLSFTMVSGGDLVTGKILPIESLAVYQVAYGLACIPLIEIVRVLSTMMFSVFSRIQNDSARLVSAFLRFFALVCMICACSVAGFTALGSTFTRSFLPSDYSLVALLLPVLSLWGASRALGAVNTILFQAIGRPALATIFQTLMVVMFFVLAIPLTINFGLLGLAWGLVIAGGTSHIGRFFVLTRVLEVKPKTLFLRAITPVLVGIFSYLVCTTSLKFATEFDSWIQFFMGAFIFITSFVTGCLVTESILDFGILKFVRQYVPGIDYFVLTLRRLAKQQAKKG